MTRAEAALMLEQALAAFGVPVVAGPVDAVVAPAVVLMPGAPYRDPAASACWQHAVDALVIGGRMDDVGVYDELDALADTFCRIRPAGVVNRGAPGAPERTTIGQVDYLAVTFNLTLYDLGPGLAG